MPPTMDLLHPATRPGDRGLLAARRSAAAHQPSAPLHAGHRRRSRLRGGRSAVGADPPAADHPAGFRPGAVDHRRGAGADGRAVPAPPARLHILSHLAAADHAAAPVAQRRGHPADPVARQRGPPGRRPCRRRVRRLPDGWRRGDRPDRVRHPAGGELHGHHQGLRAHRRGRRAVQPRLHAGQADGDRRRHVRWPDRRKNRAPAPQGPGGGKRLLRCHGRCGQVRARRCDRRADHHGDQHSGWAGDRSDPARHAVRRRRGDLHHSHGGRWPGFANPRAAGLHRRGHRGDQGRHRGIGGRRVGASARRQSEAAGNGRRRSRGAGVAARPAGAAVPSAGRTCRWWRLAALQEPAGRRSTPPPPRLPRRRSKRPSRTRCAWT